MPEWIWTLNKVNPPPPCRLTWNRIQADCFNFRSIVENQLPTVYCLKCLTSTSGNRGSFSTPSLVDGSVLDKTCFPISCAEALKIVTFHTNVCLNSLSFTYSLCILQTCHLDLIEFF